MTTIICAVLEPVPFALACIDPMALINIRLGHVALDPIRNHGPGRGSRRLENVQALSHHSNQLQELLEGIPHQEQGFPNRNSGSWNLDINMMTKMPN